MKVLLINPPTDQVIATELPGHVSSEVGSFPPLGLLYLASGLRGDGGHAVSILDMPARRVGLDALPERLRALGPELVGITAITHNLVGVRDTAAVVHQTLPGVPVVMGGPHVNAFPAEAARLPGIDFAIAGEGERSMRMLVDALAGGAAVDGIPGLSSRSIPQAVQPPVFERDLDGLTFPARDLVRAEDYFYVLGKRSTFATIIASRGCPYQCIFCSTPHGGYRTRSPANIVDEVEVCLAAGAEEIHFVDDTFNLGSRRLAEISEEIIRRKVPLRWSFRGRADGVDAAGAALARRAGCVRMHLGVETGTPEGLELLRKGVALDQIERAVSLARQNRIVTAAYFIIGCPHEKTARDVNETIRFAVQLSPDFAMFNILAIYPGTELFDMAVARGLLAPDFWTGFALDPRPDFTIPLWEEHLDRATLDRLLTRAYRRFYLRPGMIWRNLRELGSVAELRRKAAAGLSILRGRS
jgi:anaerobic magnesium-protoporphyrin IX monomethyl ester cyclase